MSKKIGKEEIEAFVELEKKILSTGESSERISYRKDEEIESKIKYSILCENFTQEMVDIYLKNSAIEILDLCNQNTYVKVFNSLK